MINSFNEVHCNEDNETKTTANFNVDKMRDNMKEHNIVGLPVQN